MRTLRERLDRLDGKLSDMAGGKVILLWLIGGALFCLFCFYGAIEYDEVKFPDEIETEVTADVAAFYRAGSLAWEGRALDAYDVEIFESGLEGENSMLLFLNPPTFLPFTQLLSLGTYGQAKLVILILCLLSLGFLPWILKAPRGLAVFCLLGSAGYYGLILFNISCIIIAMIALALMRAEKNPVFSGLLLGLATVKPQYGLLVPVFLLARGQYLTILVAGITAIGLLLLSCLLYGFDAPLAWYEAFSQKAYQTYLDAPPLLMLSLHATLAKIGIQGGLADGIYLLVLVGLAASLWYAVRRFEFNGALGLMFLAAALASPSVMLYSWAIFLAAYLCMLRLPSPWPLHLQILFGALLSQPFLMLILQVITRSFELEYAILIFVNMAAAFLAVFHFLQTRLRENIRQEMQPAAVRDTEAV